MLKHAILACGIPRYLYVLIAGKRQPTSKVSGRNGGAAGTRARREAGPTLRQGPWWVDSGLLDPWYVLHRSNPTGQPFQSSLGPKAERYPVSPEVKSSSRLFQSSLGPKVLGTGLKGNQFRRFGGSTLG
jgi:hypothetical protein